MKTAYIIATGEYSDYRVHMAFSNEAEAEAAAKHFTDGSVTAIPMDVPPENWASQIGIGNKWDVIMRNDGVVLLVKERFHERRDCDSVFFDFAHNPPVMFVQLLADSKEGAVKIANERRVQILAANQWGNSVREWSERGW